MQEFEIDVLAVLDHLKLDGQVIQQEFVAKCIFHKDQGRPNLEINSVTGLWHCWVCQEKGNLPGLVMRAMRVPYREALGMLHDYSTMPDIAIVRRRNLKELKTIIRSRRRIKLPEVDIAPYRAGRSWWLHNSLPNGTFDLEMVNRFKLGYDTKYQRAIIPVKFNGRWVGLIKRAVNDQQYPRYLYNTGFDKRYVLYGWDAVPEQENSCVLVEGAKDAIRGHSFGIDNVQATMGTGISDEQEELIVERFDEITIFMDNDPAGHIVALKVAKKLAEQMPRVYMVRWHSQRKDPNELSAKQWRRHLRTKIHWSAFLEDGFMS